MGYGLEEDWEEDQQDFIESRNQAYVDNNKAMKARYQFNSKAAIGSEIACACCSKVIVKKSYQTQFCSNKGPGNCKDKYWNNTDEKRRLRAQTICM